MAPCKKRFREPRKILAKIRKDFNEIEARALKDEFTSKAMLEAESRLWENTGKFRLWLENARTT